MIVPIKDLKRQAASRGADCQVTFDSDRGLVLIRLKRKERAFMSPVEASKLAGLGEEMQIKYLESVVEILADRLDMDEKERYKDGIGRPEK